VPDGIRCDALRRRLAFGGPEGRRVFIAATSSLYAVARLLM
jgi:hypothetical protein